MSETKPLTQVWRDAAQKMWDEGNNGESVGTNDCALHLEQFAATHLAPQSEPSEEDWQAAAEYAERESLQSIRIAWERMHAVNEFKKRIRELLCGNS